MDSSTFTMLKALAPVIPSLAGTALKHSLGLTPTANERDARTEVTVQAMRFVMGGLGKPRPIGQLQAVMLQDPGVKGPMWIAKATIPPPDSAQQGLTEAVFRAIEELKVDPSDELKYTKPGLVDVEVEWTGYRPGAAKDAPLPNIDEKEKYARLLGEDTRINDTTVLYFHGGAYYVCDPATHRLQCSRLAKECGGKVCNVRYRLAPQTAFPGQLLDALQVYLSLLYPPAGSMHEPVKVQHIIFAGDSAGGNLAFALLQLLLHFHRATAEPTILFHGKEVSVPLPGGVSGNSAWFDITRSMASMEIMAKYDYLPPVSHDKPMGRRPIPPDAVWPTDPPRGDFFCDLSLLDHPLTSMLGAASWAQAPPLWLMTGWEMLSDEIRVVASRAAGQGVKVQYEEYEAMPHVFQMLLPWHKSSAALYRSWGEFCRKCAVEPEAMETNGKVFKANTGEEASIEVGTWDQLTFTEVKQKMRSARDARIKSFGLSGTETTKATL